MTLAQRHFANRQDRLTARLVVRRRRCGAAA